MRRVKQDKTTPARHTGFKAVSTGRAYNKPTPTTPPRHSRVGGNPQGGWATRMKQDKPTDRIPLSLDGDLCKTVSFRVQRRFGGVSARPKALEACGNVRRTRLSGAAAPFQRLPRALGRAHLRLHARCRCRSRTSARRRLYAVSLNSISVSFRASPS